MDTSIAYRLSEHGRAVGLELYQNTYSLCAVDLSDGGRHRSTGSLKVSSWAARLAKKIMEKDLVLMMDDHPRYGEVAGMLESMPDVTVLVGSFSRLGGMWLSAGADRGAGMATLLSRYLMASAQDADGFASVAKSTKRRPTAMQAVKLGLYMQELVARSDAIRRNLDDLTDGRNLEVAIRKALDMEIDFREPLEVDSMNVPKRSDAGSMQSKGVYDDGTFLSEYAGYLEQEDSK